MTIGYLLCGLVTTVALRLLEGAAYAPVLGILCFYLLPALLIGFWALLGL